MSRAAIAAADRSRLRPAPRRRRTTERRANSARSAVVEQVVAPGDRAAQRLLARGQVARAAGQQRQPVARAARASPAGGSSRTRAAASSIASGRPSRRTQISATAGAFSFVEGEVRAGPPARARRTARRPRTGESCARRGTAGRGPGRPSGGTGYSCSPYTLQRRAAGDQDRAGSGTPRAASATDGAAPQRPARSCRGRAARVALPRCSTSAFERRSGRRLAHAERLRRSSTATRSGSVIGASADEEDAVRRTRSQHVGGDLRARAASCRSRPGPVSVSRRVVGEQQADASATSRSRPRNGVSWAGRLFGGASSVRERREVGRQPVDDELEDPLRARRGP